MKRETIEYTIREIRESDNPAVREIIHTVMPEFGATGAGFAIEDPEVDAMFEAYQGEKKVYYVVEMQSKIVGGAGIAPLKGENAVCELQKMYFLKEARGMGIGARLLHQLLSCGKRMGFKKIYLETLSNMEGAQRLYLKAGFVKGDRMGNTGHCGCNLFYYKEF